MTYLDPQRAADLFAERLATQTDVSDVHAALSGGDLAALDGGGDRAVLSGGDLAALDGGGDRAALSAGDSAAPAGGDHATLGGADRAALALGDFVLLDVRSDAAWEQGHIPGAIHLPHARIHLDDTLRLAVPVVAYCWGPGCNGATRAALALARRGFRVKEMLGGIEYWIREGFPLRTPAGDVRLPVDTLTACGC